MSVSTYARRYLVRFEPMGWSVAVSSGTTLLAAARLAGISLPATCNGQGDCCQCGVVVLEGKVSITSDLEDACMEAGSLDDNQRLACCVRILSSVQVLVPESAGLRTPVDLPQEF